MEAIYEEREGFAKRHPYKFGHQVDPKTGHHAFSIHAVEDPPEGLGVLIGDALYNFHSALDHLVWQFTLANGNVPPNPIPLRSRWRNVAFPIFRDKPTDFRKKTARNLWGLTENARRFIANEQPFAPGKGDPTLHPLWVLYELSNADKHRTFHLTSHYLQWIRAVGSPMKEGQKLSVYPVSAGKFPGPFEKDTVLAVFGIDPPQPELNFQPEAHLDIAFDKGSAPVEGVPVLRVLASIGAHIEELLKRARPHLPARVSAGKG